MKKRRRRKRALTETEKLKSIFKEYFFDMQHFKDGFSLKTQLEWHQVRLMRNIQNDLGELVDSLERYDSEDLVLWSEIYDFVLSKLYRRTI